MRIALLWMCISLPLLAQNTLQHRIAEHAMAASGRVGVACSLPGVKLDCNLNAAVKLPMQSVYKLPIAMAILDAAENGKLALDQKVRFLPSDLISPGQHSPLRDAYPRANVEVPMEELLRLAVSESDGVASDILLRATGGPPVVDGYVKSLGIGGIRIRDTEKTLGSDVHAQYENYAEPAALVQLLRRLADTSPLSVEHTDLLLKWMSDTPTGQHRLKALLPAGTRIAHKTGTSGTDAGITHATNDIGLITLPDGRQLAIAVLITDSPKSEAIREDVIGQIGFEVWKAAVQ
jgi:beta-lactamase class A